MVRQLQLTVIAALLVLAGSISASARSSMPADDRWNAQHIDALPPEVRTPPTRTYVAGRWRLNTRSRGIFKTEM